MNSKEIYDALRAPFPLSELEWRVQSSGRGKSAPGDKALMLAYVTARAVFNRLTEVLGVDGWSTEHRQIVTPTVTIRRFKGSRSEWVGGKRQDIPEDVEVHEQEAGWACKLTLRIGDSYVTHEDASEETDIASLKGGFSKSLVRCAVRVGIGAYLYDLPDQWVTLEGTGNKGFPPRNFQPTNFPASALPAKGPTGVGSPARVVDAAPPITEPKPKPQPASQPQPLGQVAAEKFGLPDNGAAAAWERIKKWHSVIPVPFDLSLPVDTKKEREDRYPYVFYAEAGLRPDAERRESKHWNKMLWVIDLDKHKADPDWPKYSYYKRMLALHQWILDVQDATSAFDPLDA